MGEQIEKTGPYLAGFLCLVLTVLKLTLVVHWSWWRVLLPLWVLLGHNAQYITIGFIWLRLADDGAINEEAVAYHDDRLYGYQLGAMLAFLMFADNLVRRIEGSLDVGVFGLSTGGTDRIWVSGVLSVACHLLFWSALVPLNDRDR